MASLETEGRYQGIIKDHGVSKTSVKGLPQFVATFLVTHVFNDITEEWDDWEEYGLTIDAFSVLTTLNEQGVPIKCLNYDQVMEATGWDGVAYAGLAAMDLKNHPIQFRVQKDKYEDKNGVTIEKMKVNWITSVDGDMGLRKVTGDKLADLDAKFGVPGNKPAATAAKPKAKAGKKTAPKPAEAETKTAPPPVKPPARKAAPKPPAKAESGEEATEEEAYNAIHAYNVAMSEPVPDEIKDDYWTSAVDEVAADSNSVTATEWPVIRDKTIEKLDIPF